MSIVPKENIEVIAQSIGINNLSSDVALSLAPDVEYRLREIMQVFSLFTSSFSVPDSVFLFLYLCVYTYIIMFGKI